MISGSNLNMNISVRIDQCVGFKVSARHNGTDRRLKFFYIGGLPVNNKKIFTRFSQFIIKIILSC